jgi:deazaflavin-dependent oxidoreductase (nitroreductase family)
MVLPRWLARFNRRVTNRVLGRIPSRWSPLVLLHHVGRTSGKQYSTPLAAFRTDFGFVFALTYGPGADWVQNVLGADSFAIDARGVRHELAGARLIPRTEASRYLPTPVRVALRLLRVEWFLAAERT